MIERCTAHLEMVKKTVSDICGDEYVEMALEEMATEGIPQSVQADADALRESTLVLADFVHEQACSHSLTELPAGRYLTGHPHIILDG